MAYVRYPYQFDASATAGNVVVRDASANAFANEFVEGFSTTATAAGTTTLTKASSKSQRFTGVTTQTVTLPDCTTLTQTGFAFLITNRSTGAVTVNDSSSALVLAVPANTQILFTCTSIASAAGSWDAALPTIAASELPTPTSTTLGGVKSLSSSASNFLTSLGTDGVLTKAQPAFTDISGSVAATQLPNPSSSTLGGVQSVAAVTSNFLTSISTSGVPAKAQPAFTDISGSVAATQLPNPSSSTLGGVKSLAAVSNNFLTSIGTDGIPVAAQPTLSNLTGTSFTGTSGSAVTFNSSLTAGGGTGTAAFNFISTVDQGTTDRVFRFLDATSTEVLSAGGDGLLRVVGGTGQVNAGTVSGSQLLINGSQADGATSIGVVIRCGSAYSTAGAKILQVKNGSSTEKFSLDLSGRINSPAGNADSSSGKSSAMSLGTITVSTTAVTASSQIFLTHAGAGVLANYGTLYVGTIVAGTSFVINSTNATDTDTVNWRVIN